MSKYVQLEIPFDFEEFRPIEGYEGEYQVSNQGKVYSLISKKFLKPRKTKLGYLDVVLYKNGKHKRYLLHRLVANAFIPNPLHLPQINHISEIKTENHVSNLEWCNASYNNTYGTRIERALPKILANPNWKASHEKCGRPKKQVLQFTKEGEFVNEFVSAREASRQTGISQSSITKCCNGKSHSARKFLWKFKDVS